MNPLDDGVSHINVYSKGKTWLGKFLSNFADCNVMTEDGQFRTIEGYWYWLSCAPSYSDHTIIDPLRFTNGWESKVLGRKLRGKDWVDDPEFKHKILSAIAYKVINSKPCMEEMKRTELPFVHYYIYDDKVIDVPECKWILDFLEFLRLDIQEGRTAL